jgi:hypothetical protein
MKNRKKEIIIWIILIIFVLFKFFISKGNGKALNETYSFMKKVPWSVPYVITSILILYFLGRLPFFKGVQLRDKPVDINENRKNEGIIIDENMSKEPVSLGKEALWQLKREIIVRSVSERRKSTGKEIFATIVYGLIFFAFIIGFFVVMMI